MWLLVFRVTLSVYKSHRLYLPSFLHWNILATGTMYVAKNEFPIYVIWTYFRQVNKLFISCVCSFSPLSLSLLVEASNVHCGSKVTVPDSSVKKNWKIHLMNKNQIIYEILYNSVLFERVFFLSLSIYLSFSRLNLGLCNFSSLSFNGWIKELYDNVRMSIWKLREKFVGFERIAFWWEISDHAVNSSVIRL